MIDNLQAKLILRIGRKITQQETLDLCLEYANAHFEDIFLMTNSEPTLTPEKAKNIIPKLISSEHYDGFYFPRRNYVGKERYLKYGYFSPDYQCRLFKKNKKIDFSGFIHEQPTILSKKSKKINYLEIYHSSSHSKYNSLFSIIYFTPYFHTI